MNMELAFRTIFKNFKNTCYVVETDLNTNCVDKSNSCAVCGGTGNIIKKIYKTTAVIDAGKLSTGTSRYVQETDMGLHYKDGRLAYFLKDCNFDLSPNISRMVLNIVNGQIVDIFNVLNIEPVVADDHVIYYEAIMSRSNINSLAHLQTYNSLIKGR